MHAARPGLRLLYLLLHVDVLSDCRAHFRDPAHAFLHSTAEAEADIHSARHLLFVIDFSAFSQLNLPNRSEFILVQPTPFRKSYNRLHFNFILPF